MCDDQDVFFMWHKYNSRTFAFREPSIKIPRLQHNITNGYNHVLPFQQCSTNQMTIYINQHHSTKRHFIYIYISTCSLFPIYMMTNDQTNEPTNILHKPQPIYDDTPKHNVISFISLSLAYSYPFILFHSFYQFHLPLTKNPSNIYSYALSFLLLDQQGLQDYITHYIYMI